MNVWLCFRVAARDKGTLHSLGITHIVNAAHGASDAAPGDRFYVKTGPQFYRDMRVDYYGVEADDAIEFILSPFFYPTARYIRAALAMGGKSVIRCYGSAAVLDSIRLYTECQLSPSQDECLSTAWWVWVALQLWCWLSWWSWRAWRCGRRSLPLGRTETSVLTRDSCSSSGASTWAWRERGGDDDRPRHCKDSLSLTHIH